MTPAIGRCMGHTDLLSHTMLACSDEAGISAVAGEACGIASKLAVYILMIKNALARSDEEARIATSAAKGSCMQ